MEGGNVPGGTRYTYVNRYTLSNPLFPRNGFLSPRTKDGPTTTSGPFSLYREECSLLDQNLFARPFTYSFVALALLHQVVLFLFLAIPKLLPVTLLLNLTFLLCSANLPWP